MMGSHPGLSTIPLLCVVVLAIKFGQVYIALFAGSLSGTTIPTNGNVLNGAIDTIERCVRVFEDVSNVKTILFCIFIGAPLEFTQHSGGIQCLINLLSIRKSLTKRPSAQFLTIAICALIPIESSIIILITGAPSRSICNELKICREKLTYCRDSFSAPICSLIPISARGAFYSPDYWRTG